MMQIDVYHVYSSAGSLLSLKSCVGNRELTRAIKARQGNPAWRRVGCPTASVLIYLLQD